ncbi:hypothetical protein LO771_07260 [Streptacidiphilus sp. ASG 303]|uniref:hypothetical protein n=1 Tax=Streptacidiphilus sp. ASG 303 TaxID=2896847 RepID=UPI001E42676C|nr:hypothetical protein [Streptacidiphilus sp. ASG 303]MCD0482216.1 hypothetical protein [Streptacidiphilus sp. ASG 303]
MLSALRRLGRVFMLLSGVLWFGHRVVVGHGFVRVASAAVLLAMAVTAALEGWDAVRPRRRRRKARVRDGGG